jgi:S-layer homology domain
MRRFYLVPGMLVGFLALIAASLALFTWQASAESQPYPLFDGPTATPTPLACTYSAAIATGTIIPGTDDTGNHCDDCTAEVFLPFPVSLYGQEYTLAYASSNGNLQFVTANQISFNECFPAPSFEAAIFPHWDDLLTDDNPGCPGGNCGIFTAVMGAAPNRIFTIEWRTVRYSDPFQPVNFQIWFYEGQANFDFVYGVVSNNGSDSTVGVQKDDTTYTQFSCMTASLSPNLAIHWVGQNCPTATPTTTSTPCSGCTPVPTATITRTPTTIPTATATPCGLERFNGSITNNDPQQVGRLLRDEVRSLCQVPETCPGLEDAALRHYDSYTRTNNTGSTRCVTVGLSTMCNGTQFIFAAAYLGSFDPNSICQNYLADMGVSPYPHSYMSFLLPPGSSAVIVVSEVTTNQGCPDYTVTITGLAACGTPVPTVTGTPPTATSTPTGTPTPCGYDFTTATATIVPGTQDTGNHCDDCVTNITLPFPFLLYGQEYGAANVSSNGNIQFATASSNRINTCFPAPSLSAALLPNWTDLVTDCLDCGIYTSLSGSAPNRIFNIEWRVGYFKGGAANFQARLYEGTGEFDFIYGQMDDPGNNSTVGVQNAGATTFNQYNCNVGGLNNGLLVKGIPQVCSTATSTPTVTATLPAGTPSSTPTICTTTFTDVPPGSTFYVYIQCLACRGVISGYPCGGPGEPCNGNNDPYFRPQNNVTRGQIAKIVSNSAGFQEPVSGQSFEDVLPGSTFYQFIERLASRGVISGYPCGGQGEPCVPPGNRPYSRPNGNTTRGQLSKIVCRAYGCVGNVQDQVFEDVPPGSTFYLDINRLYALGAINGYPCGGQGEPCVPPGNRPYFRPSASVTRGQTSKIVASAFFPKCNPGDRP